MAPDETEQNQNPEKAREMENYYFWVGDLFEYNDEETMEEGDGGTSC